MESISQCTGANPNGSRCKLTSINRSAYCTYHLSYILNGSINKNQHRGKCGPKSTKFMAKLKIIKPTEECPICMDITKEPLYLLKCCRTVSHYSCLSKSMKPECPFCRKSLDIFTSETKDRMNRRENQHTRDYQDNLSHLETDGLIGLLMRPIGPVNLFRASGPDNFVYSPHPPHPLMDVLSDGMILIGSNTTADGIEDIYIHLTPEPHYHVRDRPRQRQRQRRHVNRVPPVRPISINVVRPGSTVNSPSTRTTAPPVQSTVPLSTGNLTLPVLPGLSDIPMPIPQIRPSPPQTIHQVSRDLPRRSRTRPDSSTRSMGFPHLDDMLTDSIMYLLHCINDPNDNRQYRDKITDFLNNMSDAGMSPEIIAETFAFAAATFN